MTIPFILRGTATNGFNVLGTLIVICVAIPWFTVAVFPIIVMFYLVQKFYVTTARQVKRMESITRSPLYSHFGETLSGTPTIRAYKRLPDFIAENEKHVDFNQVQNMQC
jgi:ABC-type multidrug transport system fused ATPase/permease subunit